MEAVAPVNLQQMLPYIGAFVVFVLSYTAKWMNDSRKFRNSELQIEIKMKAQDASYQEKLQKTITELNGKYAAQTDFYSKMLQAERKESRKLIERIAILEDKLNRLLEDKIKAVNQIDKAIRALRVSLRENKIIKDKCTIIIKNRDDKIAKLTEEIVALNDNTKDTSVIQ
jgi:hypothetical protein